MTARNMTPEDFIHNRSIIQSRIVDAGGDLSRVRIIAVSKGHPASSIVAARQAGQVDFGENYADELLGKVHDLAQTVPDPGSSASIASPINWHFQGRLQTNKINKLKPVIDWWHTVDSMDRCSALAQRCPGATVLVQLDATDGLGDRSGARLVDISGIVAHGRDIGLNLVGLMTVAPLAEHDHYAAERCFRDLAELADGLSLPERSMGMSDDLEAAVRAGSTMVRIGSALFGPRR